MDFEDNNPLGLSEEETPRGLAYSQPDHARVAHSSKTQRFAIYEASKGREGPGRGHITYTIRVTPNTSVRRRYSEFESLRKLLRRLFPCLVVPPIPEKHTLGAYATNPAHAHEDARVIEHRQRTLANFLNRCSNIAQINESWAFERFLDPNTSWRDLMQSDPVLKLPPSSLQAPPLDPASATPAHAYLPLPNGSLSLPRKAKSLKAKDTTSENATKAAKTDELKLDSLNASELNAKEYERVIGSGLDKKARKIIKHLSTLAAEYADLGGQFNSFSLDSHGQFDKFAPAVERVGQAVDQGYISTSHLVDRLSVEFSEPLAESVQMAATARQILKYRRQRQLQVQIIKDALARQTKQLNDLQRAESEAQRMNAYLHADDRISAATEGLLIDQPADRDHVVDQEGIHDHDHEIANPRHSSENLLELSHDEPSFNEHSQDSVDIPDNSEESVLSDQLEEDGEDSEERQVDCSTERPEEEAEEELHEEAEEGDLGEDEEDLTDVMPNGNESARPVRGNSASSSDGESLIPTSSEHERAPAHEAPVKLGGSLRRGFKLPKLSHINQAIHGIMDVDPQLARRNNITRLQERIKQLEAALEVAERDAEVAASEVSAEISRYNSAKQQDIREFVRSFVRCYTEWAQKNLECWIEAKQAIANS